MKILLSQIPDGGLKRVIQADAAGLPRVAALCEQQTGTLTAEVVLKERKGSVEVRGKLQGSVAVPCNRCQDAVAVTIDHPITVTLVSEAESQALQDNILLSEGELDVSFFNGNEVDLRDLIEEEILLFFSEVVCEENDAGQCIRCGKTLSQLFEEEPASAADHPFAKMKEFLST